MSGVTVQDGKYVFVRGLGERYTTASLNGARVPSPEPEKRVVPLDLFPSGLLQSITTTKTFTPDQQGDFAGALVDIRTREFPARRTISAAVHRAATRPARAARRLHRAARRRRRERSRWCDSKRDLPALVASLGNFQGVNLNHADQNTRHQAIPQRVDADDDDGAAEQLRRRCRSAATIRSSAIASATWSPGRTRSAPI